MRARLRHCYRLAQIVLLRHVPLSWRIKRWLLWALSPRYALGVHAIVTDDGGRVLALRSAYAGQWQLPGGGVKYRESLATAIARETLEETGLPPASLRFVGLLRDGSGRGLHGLFRVQLQPGPIRLSEEHTAWEFRTLENMPPFYRRCATCTLDVSPGLAVPLFEP